MKYPIGIQSFSEIRSGGFVYVDKTALIHRLVTEGKYYFLSRPRRFGKSLLLSTIESLFLGHRELFEGLAIDSLEWEWEKSPVFHIDFNVANYGLDEAVESRLNETLGRYEREYGLDGHGVSPEVRFERLIMEAYETTGRQVVILIDEYDKPLVDTMLNEEVLDRNRMMLQAFYGVLKSLDRYIRFGMLTGVTKFGKISVFSGLNNLTDISLEAGYNDICGITGVEIDRYFHDSVASFGQSNSVGYEEAAGMLKDSYDGYHFSRSGNDIYNPFSLLNALRTGDLGSYWFESGTPTFLVKLLQSQKYVLPELENVTRSEMSLRSSDAYRSDLVPIFYQAGYLTIKGYNPLLRSYTLDYPNREVKQGFLEFLIPFYSPAVHSAGDISDMVSAVLDGDGDRFMRYLQVFFRDFPYDQIPDLEVHYQNVVYIVMKLLGFYVRTEYKTSDGRIDMVVKTDRFVYVIEFKMDSSSPDRAISQIETKGYADSFGMEGKQIIKIGATFDRSKRALADWTIDVG